MNDFSCKETEVYTFHKAFPMARERSVSEICEVLKPFLAELGSALCVAHVRFHPSS